MRAWVAAAVLSLGTASAALGQRAGGQPLLNLTAAAQAPAAGSGAATLALADRLSKEAAALERGGGSMAAAEGALRRLAAALLKSGESAGEAGSERVVLGRTLARAAADADRAVGSASGATAEAGVALVARDLNAGAAALADDKADARRVTRDALAALAQLAGAPERKPEPAREWSAIQGLPPELGAALDQAAELLSAAQGWAAYRAEAVRLRTTLREAALAAAAPAHWLAPEASAALVAQCTQGAKELASADGRVSGAAALARVARLGRLIGVLDRLDESEARKARAALSAFIASPAQAGDAEKLDAFERTLELVAARSSLPDERGLLRPLRPAWRQLLLAARQTEGKLVPVLEATLTTADPMTDPAVLAAIAAHRQIVEELRLVARLNDIITEGSPPDKEPVVAERWKRVPDRVLKLGQDMTKTNLREAAIGSLRDLCAQVDRVAHMSGEDELRKAAGGAMGAAWGRVTGNKGVALLRELSDRRTSWIEGWDRSGYAGAAGDLGRLDAIRSLLQTLRDAAYSEPDGEAYAALNGTNAWELAPEDVARLRGDLSERCAAATEAAATGDTEKCAAIVAELRAKRAVALLAGRLAYLSANRKPGSPIVEACGGEESPWPAKWDGLVADVCRYGAESGRGSDEAQAYANGAAGQVLGGLGAER